MSHNMLQSTYLKDTQEVTEKMFKRPKVIKNFYLNKKKTK